MVTVTIFVRHSADCPDKDKGELWKRCRCRKQLRWFDGGKKYRESAKTRSWQLAEKEARRIEAQYDPKRTASESSPSSSQSRATLANAIKLFLDEKRLQNVGPVSLKKYFRDLERLRVFMASKDKFYVEEITLQVLTEFRSQWANVHASSITRQKVQERLRAFLRYCYEAGWLPRVPKLPAVRITEPPTLPLSEQEYERLLAQIPVTFPKEEKARRVRALVELMRHSGLAIFDAVTLERNEIIKDGNGVHRIVTARQKTGTHVSVPIPDAVAEELLAVLNGNPRYVFWSTGNGKAQSAVTNWQHDLRSVFYDAFGKDTEFSSHCLRDTFAVHLLSKGVPMEEVSKALGHESIRTTERHYAKWDTRRQERLDSLVIGTWKEKAPEPEEA